MATSNQQEDRIKAIWNEHLDVAKALPALASAVSSAVDLMYTAMAAGGQLLVAGNGDPRRMRSTLPLNSQVVSSSSGDLSGRSRYTSTRRRLQRSETITGTNMCLPANSPLTRDQATCCWQFLLAVTARTFCARSRRPVCAKSALLD